MIGVRDHDFDPVHWWRCRTAGSVISERGYPVRVGGQEAFGSYRCSRHAYRMTLGLVSLIVMDEVDDMVLPVDRTQMALVGDLPEDVVQIAEPIQVAVADITQIVYGVFGLTLERQGHALLTHGMVISLERTGSVLSVVMAFVLMSYAFAFGLPLRLSARVVVIAASPATTAQGCDRTEGRISSIGAILMSNRVIRTGPPGTDGNRN